MQRYVSIRGGSPHARIKMLGYYVQRAITSRTIRHAATLATVVMLGTLYGRPRRRQAAVSALEAMRSNGYVPLGQVLSSGQCAEIKEWLQGRDMISVRGSGQTFRLDAVPPGTRVADFPLDSVVHCPHLLALANRPDMLALATDYLGYTPTITVMGLRWSFPDSGMDNDVQGFHRDSEAASIKLLLYLTDVDMDSGPHSYLPGSHRDRMSLRLRRYPEGEVAQRGGATVVTGPAGTALMMDTRGIHKGTPPQAKPRLLLVVQYSLLPALVYDYDPVPYHGADRPDHYVNRLIIAPPGQPQPRHPTNGA
jgi:hypothetical protein